MSGTTAPLRAVPYDRYNGTIGAIFSNDTLYVHKNDTLLVNYVTDDLYYKLYGKEFCLLYDEKYPAQSLLNMFMVGKNANTKKIDIDFRKQDFTSERVETTVGNLLCLLKKERNVNYHMMKYVNRYDIEMTLISYNPDLEYLHLFMLRGKRRGILDKTTVLQAKSFLYIPLHNIENLFSEK